MGLEKNKFGWIPDIPDYRDLHHETKEIANVLNTIGVEDSNKFPTRTSIDLRTWCPPIENQGSLGSCTANAGVALIEYFERKAYGKHLDASRLFLYKITRNLLGWTGDTGAFLRDTMKAMVLFGVPPEEYSPYIVADYDEEPSAFCYAFAQNYKTIKYYRLDTPGISRSQLVTRIKRLLNAGLPSMFGFSVYSSISEAGNDGKIPYPSTNERRVGGHAIVAVGYNDKLKITNSNDNSTTKGAFLIRNSWGTNWGDNGYGWLPYKYVTESMAVDWWSLIKSDWKDLGVFINI